jgi:hypothetical protein
MQIMVDLPLKVIKPFVLIRRRSPMTRRSRHSGTVLDFGSSSSTSSSARRLGDKGKKGRLLLSGVTATKSGEAESTTQNPLTKRVVSWIASVLRVTAAPRKNRRQRNHRKSRMVCWNGTEKVVHPHG